MWLALMIFAHFATSDSMNDLNSACVMTTGVAPVFSQASLISGRARILLISRLSSSTIGCGVPAGAMKPTHMGVGERYPAFRCRRCRRVVLGCAGPVAPRIHAAPQCRAAGSAERGSDQRGAEARRHQPAARPN